jgi:hypothetical protein
VFDFRGFSKPSVEACKNATQVFDGLVQEFNGPDKALKTFTLLTRKVPHRTIWGYL